MLTFLVSENGIRPRHSGLYPNGYTMLASKELVILPSSTVTVETGLVLQCPSHDFIHLVIDNSYNNLLKINNSIIEHNTNTPYIIVIKNMTNNKITISKDNTLCHLYSKDKAFLHSTIVEDLRMAQQVYDNKINNSTIISNDNTINVTNVEPILVVEPIVELVVEPIVELVVEPIVEPVVTPIAEPIVEHVVEPVVEPVVENLKIEEYHEEHHEDHYEEKHDIAINSAVPSNSAALKRKYIRKKKTGSNTLV